MLYRRASRRRLVGASLALCLAAAACSGGDDAGPDDAASDNPVSEDTASNDTVSDETGSDNAGDDEPADASRLLIERGAAEARAALLDRLPSDVHGVIAADLDALRAGASASQIDALLAGEGSAPIVAEMLDAIGASGPSVDVSKAATVVLSYDAGGAHLMLAAMTTNADGAVLSGGDVGTVADGGSLHEAGVGRVATLTADGTLVVGTRAAVEAVVAGGEAGSGPLAPFVDAAIADGPLDFVLALPGLGDPSSPSHTLGGAQALSGSFTVDAGQVAGALSLHAEGAESYAATYNALNRHATQADGATEAPAEFVAPATVRLPIPSFALDADAAALLEVRHIAKKFFVGMEANAYAETVVAGGAPWFDLIGTSEADGGDPPTPASTWFRWRFKDDAALAAFEANELPEGYRIAPTRFLESDDPEGEYFFLLNIYNADGGSIVGGARAEWDVYVYSPDGGPDPNPDERPRFFVVDALAEELSFDPVNLVTPAEPLSHAIVDGVVTSTVEKFDGVAAQPVWSSTFPQPDPAVNEVARFTAEMAIGNDYIYWGYGAADRVLYNATTYNWDAFFIDPADVEFVDNSRWADYLDPELVDVVYYDNSLEYVVSPLVNLDSDQLDITPEWREELIGFKGNGHQEGLMRKAVELLFRGQADAMVGFDVTNETPSTYYHVEIADPDGFAAAIDLPAGATLAPITLFAGGTESYMLTLSVFEAEGSIEGTRAEWSTYVDFGDGRPKQFVVDLHTAALAVEPDRLLNVPTAVSHTTAGSTVTTSVVGLGVEFEATYDSSTDDRRALTMDWVEAGDLVCYRSGTCDSFFYDAETLDVPVSVPSDPAVRVETPWDPFLDLASVTVFFRPNFQEYAVKRWFDLDVPIDELPFSALADATHAISGAGSLVGRTNSVVDSQYEYRGDARIEDDRLVFALDQQITNELGVGNIFTTGSFDLATGTGTQTVVDCLGPALLCSDIVPGTTSIYEVGSLNASDLDAITWSVDLAIVLGGAFGVADSESDFAAVAD